MFSNAVLMRSFDMGIGTHPPTHECYQFHIILL